MSKNKIVFTGLVENYAELKKLPVALRDDAAPIVNSTADGAALEIVATYPKRTGNLARRVYVKKRASEFAVTATVINPAPHAILFEYGTQARHNALGANRGSMPAGHVFVPVIVRRRSGMWERFKALLVKHGLVASGEAEAA